MVVLGEAADLIRGITFRKSDQLEKANAKSLSVATTKAAQESGIVEEALYHIPRSLLKDPSKLLQPGDILISTANSLRLLGRTTHVKEVNSPISFGAFMSVIRRSPLIDDTYLLHCLRTEHAHDFFMRNANTTTNISNLNLKVLEAFQIPLPPLEVQQEIVAEIEGYQKVIDGARAVVENYRPHIHVEPEWPLVELREVGDFIRGITFRKSDQLERASANSLLVATTKAAQESGIVEEALYHIPRRLLKDPSKLLQPGDILISTANSLRLLGRTTHVRKVNSPISFGAFMSVIRRNSRIDDTYLLHSLRSGHAQDYYLRHANTTTNISNLSHKSLAALRIPLPSLDVQQEIVADIEIDQRLVDANRRLIKRFEKRIQETIGRVWEGNGSNA